jgi:hypothetical protein
MLKKVMVIIMTMTLTACATTENYEKILRSWVGSSEIDLLRSWGPPNSQFYSSGTTFLTYERYGNVFIPGSDPTFRTTRIGNTLYTNTTGGSPSYNIPTSCRTIFEIRNTTIVSWRWEGNACRSN